MDGSFFFSALPPLAKGILNILLFFFRFFLGNLLGYSVQRTSPEVFQNGRFPNFLDPGTEDKKRPPASFLFPLRSFSFFFVSLALFFCLMVGSTRKIFPKALPPWSVVLPTPRQKFYTGDRGTRDPKQEPPSL